MIDTGNGPTVILIPGIQGRWEWQRPALAALARRCRTISFSLGGESGSEWAIDPAVGFDTFVTMLDDVLDRAGLDRAAICGVSYGGLVGLHYAAHRPGRVSALVVASSPGPRWQPNGRERRYMRWPHLCAPEFVLRGGGRLWSEVCAAYPRWHDRVACTAGHLWRVVTAPIAPHRMAERIRLLDKVDLLGEAGRIAAPTLIITGEPHLDRVVPVAGTREYLAVIPDAEYACLERTGHIGSVTRPERFAELVADFVQRRAETDLTDARKRA